MPDLECRQQLGAELRRVREAAGARTRALEPDFSRGYLSQVERAQKMPSSDLIETYIRKFHGDPETLRTLHDRAVDESRRNIREQQRRTHPISLDLDATADDPFSPPAIKRRYSIEAKDASYFFNDRGIIEEVQLRYTIRAREPKTRLFYEGFRYRSEQRRGVLTIETGKGCQLARVKEGYDGAVKAFLLLDKELGPMDSEPYNFTFRIIVNSSVRAEPILFYMLGSATTRRYSLCAQFRTPSLPAQIWWFAVEGTTEAMMNEDAECIFPPDLNGHYSKEFSPLINGRCYGFGWLWL